MPSPKSWKKPATPTIRFRPPAPSPPKATNPREDRCLTPATRFTPPRATPTPPTPEDERDAVDDALTDGRSSFRRAVSSDRARNGTPDPVGASDDGNTDLTPASDNPEDRREVRKNAIEESRTSFKRPVSSDRARNGTPDPVGTSADGNTDLTPASDNVEDRREVRKNAIEESRSSFKRPVSSDRARDAVPTPNASNAGGLVSSQGQAPAGTRNRLVLDGDPVAPLAPTGNRTVAADGIEEIMVPVMPNATEAAPVAAPATGSSFFSRMAGHQTVLPFRATANDDAPVEASEPTKAPLEK